MEQDQLLDALGSIPVGKLSFLSQQMSCLKDANAARETLSPSSSKSALGDREDQQLTSKRRYHDADDGSESSVIIIAAMMAGTATILTSKLRKKNRASGHHTPLFTAPLSFIMIAEFYGDEMFRKTYRMSRPTFEFLVHTVHDLLDRKLVSATEYRRETVPADVRLAITLRILACGSYCDLSLAYQVKESTVFDIFTSTCDALMERLYLEGFPKTKQVLQRIAQGFQTSRTDSSPIFGCVGALDGICVKIKKPAPCEKPSFYSRKGFYALPVQALCDSDCIFRYCSAICTGATHDALAYAVSGLKKDIDSGILGDSFYIEGDEAYTCTEQFITPFPRDNADYDQINFNFFLSSIRIHIEQAFGMLVARWRILKGGLDYSVRICTEIMCLLMKLHNFCIKYDGPDSAAEGLTQEEKEELAEDIKSWYLQTNEVAQEFLPGAQRRAITRSAVGRSSTTRTKRDALVEIVKEKDRRMPNPVPLTDSANR